MNEKKYCHEFLSEHSKLFPNDEIFLATCTFNDKGCTWRLPEDLIDDFKSKFLRVTYSELLDDEKIWIYQRWINDIIGFSQPAIQWGTAGGLFHKIPDRCSNSGGIIDPENLEVQFK